ncbi:hypothetical protein [Andreprevotia chitinilytica]|uniref:hypothetical protein n=1 Tax=Andreprevotia chitinilytica TaxID=396808 RepID=UPI00068B719C|nr:hypothetical protein [Andreprevotia chitinilytica]
MKRIPQGAAGKRAPFIFYLMLAALIGAASIAVPPVQAAEQAAPAEKNPPGDIPDSQVFVTYKSPLGFSLKVPEGWARTDRPDGVGFADKFNLIDLAVSPAASAPTVASVTANEAAALAKTGRAVKITAIKSVKRQAGTAILIAYTSNSAPNPVTSKQLRLEHHRYLFYHGGKVATLDMSAPLGADNADQWLLMANAFRWD